MSNKINSIVLDGHTKFEINIHKLGTYKEQTFISHRPVGWEVEDYGTGRFGVW